MDFDRELLMDVVMTRIRKAYQHTDLKWRIAGIQAAKQCSQLIPLCHPLMLSFVAVDLNLDQESSCVNIFTTCKLSGQTGVEMEALTAASVSALTIYDMCKAVDKDMIIGEICLLEKSGGLSGHYQRATGLE